MVVVSGLERKYKLFTDFSHGIVDTVVLVRVNTSYPYSFDHHESPIYIVLQHKAAFARAD
jgi:hypothetical protein